MCTQSMEKIILAFRSINKSDIYKALIEAHIAEVLEVLERRVKERMSS